MRLFTLLFLAIAHLTAAAPASHLQARDSRDDPAMPKPEDQDFIDTAMAAHWYWRRIHCAQDLTWDPDLARAAHKSVSACTNKIQHVSPPSLREVLKPRR
jgi:uncharacterized protein YkwD